GELDGAADVHGSEQGHEGVHDVVSGRTRPEASRYTASAAMGAMPRSPVGAPMSEFGDGVSTSKPKPAWALRAACASAGGQTLPERKRSQAKTTPSTVVKRTMARAPSQGWPG